MKDYQLEYSSSNPKMFDVVSRKKRAARIITALRNYLGKSQNLKRLTVLDVGASTGIIDSFLAKFFHQVTAIDIDQNAITYAENKFKRKNLVFKVGDAMNLKFSHNSFDVVICTQVYEHVPDSKKLFEEIYRVLKSNGICYLAAINRLWPWEPHYNLPFLSWLPRKIANTYANLFRDKNYYESSLSYWGLKKLLPNYKIYDLTQKILSNPQKYGYVETFPKSRFVLQITAIFSGVLKYFAPTFILILKKKSTLTA